MSAVPVETPTVPTDVFGLARAYRLEPMYATSVKMELPLFHASVVSGMKDYRAGPPA